MTQGKERSAPGKMVATTHILQSLKKNAQHIYQGCHGSSLDSSYQRPGQALSGFFSAFPNVVNRWLSEYTVGQS